MSRTLQLELIRHINFNILLAHNVILTLVDGSVLCRGFPIGVGEFLVAMEISGSLAALKGAECR